MEKEVYTNKEVEELLAAKDKEKEEAVAAKDKEKEEAVAKERARANAVEEAARIAIQAAKENAAISSAALQPWCDKDVSQKCLAFAACVPYAKLRCREQHQIAANIFQY